MPASVLRVCTAVDACTAALSALTILLIVLLTVKDYEVILVIRWAVRHGADYASAMRSAVARWHVRPGTFSPEEVLGIYEQHGRSWEGGPVKRILVERLGERSGFVLNHVYRWPQLMTALSVAVFLQPPRLLCALAVGLLAGNVVLQTAHYIVNRLQMGAMDSYFRRFTDFRVRDVPPPCRQDVSKVSQDLLRDFVTLVGTYMLVLMWSFAAIYYGTAQLEGVGAAFANLPHAECHGLTVLDMLYFSILTTATVGYHDFGAQSYWIKFFVVIHHLCCFAVVLLMVTAFTLTSETPDRIAGARSRSDR